MRANLLCGEVKSAIPGAVSEFFSSHSPDLLRCTFLLRLQDRGTPFMAYTFDGMAVHRIATFNRLTPVGAVA